MNKKIKITYNLERRESTFQTLMFVRRPSINFERRSSDDCDLVRVPDNASVCSKYFILSLSFFWSCIYEPLTTTRRRHVVNLELEEEQVW